VATHESSTHPVRAQEWTARTIPFIDDRVLANVGRQQLKIKFEPVSKYEERAALVCERGIGGPPRFAVTRLAAAGLGD
jgi:hypothetical protein